MATARSLPFLATREEIHLDEMHAGQSEEVARLIGQAMNPSEGEWAARSFALHYFLQSQNVHDGRRYFVATAEGRVVGITGLHCYEWGPPDVTWMGWFAVAKEFHGCGLGAFLMRETIDVAKTLGYRKLFVETYSSNEFARARKFYEKFGFVEAGHVKEYISETSDMVVFSMDLAK